MQVLKDSFWHFQIVCTIHSEKKVSGSWTLDLALQVRVVSETRLPNDWCRWGGLSVFTTKPDIELCGVHSVGAVLALFGRCGTYHSEAEP